MLRPRPEAKPSDETDEGPAYALVSDSSGAFRDEEAVAQPVVPEAGSLRRVGSQRRGRRGMQRHQARLVELGVEHSKVWQLGFKLDIVEPQSRDLARPQARGCQQADDGGVRMWTQGIAWPQPSSGLDQRPDLLIRIDVGAGPTIARDEPFRWNLGLRH